MGPIDDLNLLDCQQKKKYKKSIYLKDLECIIIESLQGSATYSRHFFLYLYFKYVSLNDFERNSFSIDKISLIEFIHVKQIKTILSKTNQYSKFSTF